MTLLPPFRNRRRAAADSAFASLEQEFAQERASALGRMGRRLESTLADLAAHDAAVATGAKPGSDAARMALRQAAGEALWLLVVQREVIGLGDMRAVIRDYRVPADVVAVMGPAHRAADQRAGP